MMHAPSLFEEAIRPIMPDSATCHTLWELTCGQVTLHEFLAIQPLAKLAPKPLAKKAYLPGCA